MSEALPPLNIMDPGFLQDPYTYHRRYREHDPVFRSAGPGGTVWFITGYEELKAALKDARFRSGGEAPTVFLQMAPERRKKYAEIEAMLSEWLIIQDGETHHRRRKILSTGFVNSRVQAMRPLIEGLVKDLLEGLKGKTDVEFLSEFCYQLPAMVINQMLGFPAEDRERLVAYSNKFAYLMGFGQADDAFMDGLVAEHQVMKPYLLDQVAQRRAQPGEDVLSTLVHS